METQNARTTNTSERRGKDPSKFVESEARDQGAPKYRALASEIGGENCQSRKYWQ